MSTLRRPAAPRREHHGAYAAGHPDRHRGDLLELRRGLHELSRAAELPGARVVDVQLLIQICDPDSYAAFREARHKAWRRRGAVFTTTAWPERLAGAGYGALLLPLAAGQGGLAEGKHPSEIADPVFMTGPARGGARPDDIALGAVTRWTIKPRPQEPTPLLAPPVLEVIARRGVVDRRLVGWALEWHLPAPEGF